MMRPPRRSSKLISPERQAEGDGAGALTILKKFLCVKDVIPYVFVNACHEAHWSPERVTALITSASHFGHYSALKL